jgi:putative two-component system response regulator
MQANNPLLLIVDDFEVVQRPYRYLLSQEGCRVEFAVSGQEALDKALELQPDVIFMDISLPGIDGFEVTRRLKADQRTCAIPVVMLTAFGFESARAEICDAGFVSVLSKPCAPKVMLAEISRVLDWRFSR